MTKTFTDQNFEEEVLKSEVPVFVDFWAPWCGPCKMMGPIIDSLAEKYGDKAKIGKLDVDQNPIASQKYEISSIPNMKLFFKGEIIADFIGVRSEDTISEEIDKLLK